MESNICIFTVVDVIESLSGGTLLNGNLCMMDNSPWESTNQGTPNLCTLCYPGQTITWKALAVDVQTPLAIKSITFLSADGTPSAQSANHQSEQLDLNVWSGVVPCWMLRGVEYRYRFELQMYEGKNSVMYVDTPSLKRI